MIRGGCHLCLYDILIFFEKKQPTQDEHIGVSYHDAYLHMERNKKGSNFRIPRNSFTCH